MARSVAVGILLGTATPGERIASLAHRAEQRGFDEVWVAEEYFGYGGAAAAGLAIEATRSIGVGLGIVNTVSRLPGVTAMELATLARAGEGRFIAAIGHGAPWKIGARVDSPLRTLETTIATVRALLAGGTIDGVTLPHPATLPLLTGVMRPRSLELSGRMADGTLMSVLAGTRYLEESWVPIRRGMAAAGRAHHLLPTYVLCHVADDGAAARAALRPLVAYYLARIGAGNPLSAAYGLAPEITAMVERGGVDEVERAMPDFWIDDLAIAGSPDEVAAGIERYRLAGATSVVAVPLADRTAEQLDALAERVLPLLG